MGRNRKEPTLYSESEEYDDTDTSGGETSAALPSHNHDPPLPPLHQNIFSTSSNIHSVNSSGDPTLFSAANSRGQHPSSNGTPLQQPRQGVLNNQQTLDPSKRQNVGREGVMMGERSLLTNRISNFNNNPGNMMNNNQQQQQRHAGNTALNNLNTRFLSPSVGANNLVGPRTTAYRPQLNL